ncbi:unnamed protein product, partial [Ectocarpus sp. 4 AP-2014]
GDWDSGVATDSIAFIQPPFFSSFAVCAVASCPRPTGITTVVHRLGLVSSRDKATLLSALTTRSDDDLPSATGADLPVAGLTSFQALSQAGCHILWRSCLRLAR